MGPKGFLDPPHIRLICRELVRSCYSGQNLIIQMPPRHGKSFTISKAFPAWFLNEWPDKHIILTSYEADFAASWGRSVRDLIEENQDKLRVSIKQNSKAANRWDTDAGGSMITAGVQGRVTGKGAHAFIVDDPIKNFEQATSKTYQDKNWDWWRSVAYTRQEPGSFYVMLLTRWSQDDLAGRILKHDQDIGANRWKEIRIPALAEENDPLGRAEGEALWPERYSAEKLLEIKDDIGSHMFAALYQQRPTQLGGSIFKREWFNYWYWRGDQIVLAMNDGTEKIVNPGAGYRFTTTDPAISTKETADYTVVSEWLHMPTGELLLMDRYRDRIEAPEILQLHRSMWNRGGLKYMGIETVAFQSTIFQQLSRPHNGDRQIAMRQYKPDKDKITRAIPAAALMESGKLFWHRDAPYLTDWEDEFLMFPNGAHDDQVDTCSAAVHLITRDAPNTGCIQLNMESRPSHWRF